MVTNAQRIQANNAELREAIELAEKLPEAGTAGGEDVTAETDAYTEKLTALETAITALETELEGKAAGGGVSVETYTGTISSDFREGVVVYYTDDTFTLRSELVPVVDFMSSNEPLSITVAANTVVYICHEQYVVSVGGDGVTVLAGIDKVGALPISNNFRLNVL